MLDRSGPAGRAMYARVRHRSFSRLLAVALAIVLLATVGEGSAIATSPSPEAITATSAFPDVGGVHEPAIEALAELGVLTECAGGGFCPNQRLLRSTMAVWLVRAIDGVDPASAEPSRFVDVDQDRSWVAHVERLADLGVTAGCTAEPLRYCPNAGVTRAQMATFLGRAFGQDWSPAPPAGFTDIDGHALAKDIDALAAAGVTQGCAVDPLRYCPNAGVTRAQMATFLARVLGLLDPQPTEDDPDDLLLNQNLAREVSGVVRKAGSSAQICVTTHREDDLVYIHNGDQLMVPASLMKVVTGAVALELIGPEAVYTTRVVVASDAAVTDGELDGDIFLVGGGDPVLSTPHYINRWPTARPYTNVTDLANLVAAELTSRGITTITGRVVADESRYPDGEREYASETFGEQDQHTVWKRGYLWENQAGPLSGLMLNHGYSRYPSYLRHRENTRAPDPAVAAAALFDDLLEARGFVIKRSPVNGVAPVQDKAELLGSVASPPMSQIVGRMLKFSDNTIAEMVLKEIGHHAGFGSDRDSAAEAVASELTKMGLWQPGMVIMDGSGLSIHNRITCDLISALLLEAGPGSALQDGLAVSGTSGTLLYCYGSDRDAIGRVKAKTGALNDVTALAGVTESRNGDLITFAMMANGEMLAAHLGFSCNRLQRHMIDSTFGHPYTTTAFHHHPHSVLTGAYLSPAR